MSKSRSERGGKTPAQAQPPPAPVSNDVVPGRLTETDWNHLLDEETEEDFVTDILQDVITNALDTIYTRIIDSRVIPYTVNAARELLLDVIEWQFLVNDPGENNVETDNTWLEDEEPSSGVTDSWAQGIVPVVVTNDEVGNESQVAVQEDASHDLYDEMKENETSNNQNELAESLLTTAMDSTTLSEFLTESIGEKKLGNSAVEKETKKKPVPKPPKTKKVPEQPFKPYRGRIPSYHSISMTPVTDERPRPGNYHPREALNENGTGFLISSESIMKTHYGRPPGTKDVAYDHKGNVVHVQKLNIERLPSHRVKTRFTVIDPLEEAFQAKLANKKQRYNFLRNESKEMQQHDRTPKVFDKKTAKEKELKLVSPLPPPLVDTMDVSAGVVIKEKGVIKRGLRQPLNQFYMNDASQLQPLGSTTAGPPLTIRDIISESNPIVKHLNSTKPLPAIPSRGNFN